MTYPENLQEIAFNAFDDEEAIHQPTQDFRLNVAKRILSAVGFTEPKPPFKLPPPPPSMKWHREDGWTEDMLPKGWRPLLVNEKFTTGDQWMTEAGWLDCLSDGHECEPFMCHSRTKRPLTFTHKGHEWTWHRPGDPRPVDAATSIDVVTNESYILRGQKVKKDETWFGIIGWRYTDAPKSELEIIKEEVKNLVQRIKKLEYGGEA